MASEVPRRPPGAGITNSVEFHSVARLHALPQQQTDLKLDVRLTLFQLDLDQVD